MATATATVSVYAPNGTYVGSFASHNTRQNAAYLVGYRNGNYGNEWDGHGYYWYADLTITFPAGRIVSDITVSFQYNSLIWQQYQNVRFYTGGSYQLGGSNTVALNLSNTGSSYGTYNSTWASFSKKCTVTNGYTGTSMFLRIENYVTSGSNHYFFACCIDTLSVSYTYTVPNQVKLKVNSSTWKTVTPYIKINSSTWKQAKMWVNVDGTHWKSSG